MSCLTLEQALQTAIVQHQAGRLSEAEPIYRQILAIQPQQPDALHLLGVLAHQVGQDRAAVDLISQAIQVYARQADYHSNLGEAYRGLGCHDDAIACYQRALSLQPEHLDARQNLGIAHCVKGRLNEGIECYKHVLTLHPNHPAALCNLGTAFLEKKEYAQAVTHFQQVREVQSDYPEIHYKLACALHRAGRITEAIACYRRTLAANPQQADAHWNLALALLLLDAYEEGWREYEWRWQTALLLPSRPNSSQPLWDGGDLAGRTILLIAEQGFGDDFQFIRYLPLIAARGGKIILLCEASTLRLFQPIPEIWHLTSEWGDIPPFDVYCPLMSLPLAFGTTLATIPVSVPYLQSEATAQADWREKLATDSSKRKIGLVWAGRPTHGGDAERSITLSTLAPLANVPDVSFYSLQKGDAAAQVQTASEEMKIIDHTAELHDFADTAALIAHLDLVIAVDTAVVHLAGALGKPVWVVLPSVPDWRWGLERENSPWYPTIRLFRQKSPGDWSGVIESVRTALTEMSH